MDLKCAIEEHRHDAEIASTVFEVSREHIQFRASSHYIRAREFVDGMFPPSTDKPANEVDAAAQPVWAEIIIRELRA